MTTTPLVQSVHEEEEEVIRLVAIASRQSRGDPYPGKRNEPRFRADLRLEAALDRDEDADVFPVTLHNISGAGLAFWARREVDPGTSIYIREFSGDASCMWVGADATHCTYGLRGFLVGAAFNHPAAIEELVTVEPEPVAIVEVPNEPQDAQRSPPKRGGLLGWLGLS